MKTKKFIVLIILFAFCIAIFSGCSKKAASNEDSLSKLKAKGYVVVGLDDTFAPMGFKDTKGDIVGFDIDLAKEVFKRIGINVKFQSIDWSMKETELNSGNIDLIWNGYSITDERKQKVAFTNPYLENRQLIITLANSNIQSKKDLQGKKVAVQNGSSSLDALNKEPEVLKSLSSGKPVLFDTNNEAFMDLEAGRVDAVIADEVLARYYMKERGIEKYKVLQEDFGKEQYAVGIRKADNELVSMVNSELENMKKDGTSAEISKKWFGSNIVK
ncbi:amino acid ABC transporter substrate-binding protein [Candidatus Clostridium radicumherbarum]|uniref:Amino acid ABC transporter substrate-binding protein n=1 Tax=Candidatus Clostridium radicumherbarum TaxID=3381662 RepID=A0ABW8TMW9_9CLOT